MYHEKNIEKKEFSGSFRRNKSSIQLLALSLILCERVHWDKRFRIPSIPISSPPEYKNDSLFRIHHFTTNIMTSLNTTTVEEEHNLPKNTHITSTKMQVSLYSFTISTNTLQQNRQGILQDFRHLEATKSSANGL